MFRLGHDPNYSDTHIVFKCASYFIESNIVAQYIDKCHTQPQIVDSDFGSKKKTTHSLIVYFYSSEEEKNNDLHCFTLRLRRNFEIIDWEWERRRKNHRAIRRSNEREKRLSFYTLIKSAHFISGFYFSIIPLDKCNKSKIAFGLPENVVIFHSLSLSHVLCKVLNAKTWLLTPANLLHKKNSIGRDGWT